MAPKEIWEPGDGICGSASCVPGKGGLLLGPSPWQVAPPRLTSAFPPFTHRYRVNNGVDMKGFGHLKQGAALLFSGPV